MTDILSLEIPRSSGFTFHSSVHSTHVLRCLDEQRQRDELCDMTVAVENRSFSAHRAVLAACSDYFQSRVTAQTGEGLVITLPEEVTVKGFEPLLQFAYTAKLLFTRENILEIHNCAAILGFHNLDKACFEFLIPKFFDNSRGRLGTWRKQCSRRKPQQADGEVDERDEARLGAGSEQVLPQQRSFEVQCLVAEMSTGVAESHRLVCEQMDTRTDSSCQSLNSSTLQATCGKDRLSLENCGPQMPFLSPALTSEGSASPCLPCTDGNREDVGGCCGIRTEIVDVCAGEVGVTTDCLPCVTSTPESSGSMAFRETLDMDCRRPCRPAAAGADHSPVTPLVELESAAVMEENGTVELDGSQGVVDVIPPDPDLPGLAQDRPGSDRSSVEREVAEHLAKGFWSNLCPPQVEPLVLEPATQSTLEKTADFHWLKHLDLSSSTGDCPFLRELGEEEVQLPENGQASQLEKSPQVSSVNSGDDSDFDTEGDSESYTSERAQEVQLPFPAEDISSLSRNDFQQLLKVHQLSREQLGFVHDVRRRSKNRIAAQRCRKRKLDCIHNLECEIDKLNTEKDKLLQERNQLKISMEETLQNLSGLCQKVCSEAALPPEQLQALAKYSSLNLLPPVPGTPFAVDGSNRDPSVDFTIDFCATEHLPAEEVMATPQQPTPSECGTDGSVAGTTDCPTPDLCDPISIMGICLERNSTCMMDQDTYTPLPHFK